MNSFGRIFRVNIFGESHGQYVGVIIDGCPAGITISEADFINDIERRKGGIQKATTPRTEEDKPILASGIFNDRTTGSPITILFENKNVRSSDYEKQRSIPRPGHADFVANKKFGGNEDYRGGGHFSGRLTLCLVAAGVIAKKVVPSLKISATLIEVGGEKNIEAGIQKAVNAKDSVGGIVECIVKGIPVGLGEPFFDSVESLISHAIFSIPAVKGVEFGAGFSAAKMFGIEHNDPIIDESGKTKTNHSGGVVGGLTNGNEVVFRVAIKPTSSTPKQQESWNQETNKVESFSIKGRHDLCIALRVPPVVEACAAIIFADLMLLEQRIPRIVAF
jgi:chorismate synthase